ncbi:MAG: hypothetical protein IKY78_01495 [Clostridia bacterium]|nr:hypothetical protein [Clostridia bacterium]
MFDHIFGNTFDLNHDGKTDELERMIEYHVVMNEARQLQEYEKAADTVSYEEPLSLLSDDSTELSHGGF